MKITDGVCRRILNAMPAKPPEIGGILGSSDGIISRYQLDDGRNSGCGCFYSPDVTRLNTTIKAWQREENCIQRDIPYALFRCQYIVRG